MTDPTTTRGDWYGCQESSDDGDDPATATESTSRCDPAVPPNPTARARYLLAATAFTLAQLVFVSALPVATLCLLVGVETLVGPGPAVTVTTATGTYTVPLVRALVVVVVAHLVRRLYALNSG